MSAESTRALDWTEEGHQPQDEEIPERTWRSVMRSVRMIAVCFGPSVVLNLLLAASVAATASGDLPDPNRGLAARLLRRAATVGSLAPLVYLLVIRPWHLRWGATSEDARRPMPGDELVPRPIVESIRAVTVHRRDAKRSRLRGAGEASVPKILHSLVSYNHPGVRQRHDP